VVKDSAGTFVGVPQDCDVNGLGNVCAIRRLGNVLVRLRITADGFSDTGTINDEPLYEDPTCSGQPFGTLDFPTLIATPYVLGPFAYYAAGPARTITVQAKTQFLSQQDCANAGGFFTRPNTCCVPVSFAADVHPLVIFDLSTLGIVPPLHLEAP
jgi:hypothetical protein